jgi:hypothetical protein
MQSYVDDEIEAAMKIDEEMLFYTPEQSIPYFNQKLYDIIENIFKVKPSELTSKIPEQLLDWILLSTNWVGKYNIDVTSNGTHYFMGYPDWNYMRQLSSIFTLWNERSIFPVTFLAMSEMEDNTGWEIERLNALTDDVRDIFKMLSSGCVIDIYKKVKELLISLDVRGFMTMFGMRTSPGSQNNVWPSKSLILEEVNKKHK